MDDALLLVLDTASPTVSVALGTGAKILARRREGLRQSSLRLLPMIEECLREANLGLDDLTGLIALSGPGSFTGLRVGMATAMGLYQGRGLAVATLPTFHALAEGARREYAADRATVFALVDVLRGDWAVREFPAGNPLGEEAERISQEALLRRVTETRQTSGAEPILRGFGVGRLAAVGFAADALQEPETLAADALRHFAHHPRPWDPGGLTQPLYFRPPAATPPGPPKRLLDQRTHKGAATGNRRQ
ncbi:MAG: tRNA (adenosine(37)-N6)-threonylcarbamoyltransferase complex dimerization subunit type 1 TsaB [Acidobacteriota bacterium]